MKPDLWSDFSLYKAPYYKSWKSFQIFWSVFKGGLQGWPLFFIIATNWKPLNCPRCPPHQVMQPPGRAGHPQGGSVTLGSAGQLSWVTAQWRSCYCSLLGGVLGKMKSQCPKGVGLPPRDTWQCLVTSWLSQLWRRGAIGVQWVEIRAAVEHLQSTGQLLTVEDLRPHGVSGAKAGRPAQSASRLRALAPFTAMALVVGRPGELRQGHHASLVSVVHTRGFGWEGT